MEIRHFLNLKCFYSIFIILIDGFMKYLKKSTCFFILMCALLLMKIFLFSVCLVSSPSMRPNFESGDRVLANKLAFGLWLPFLAHPLFRWDEPHRGDLVFFSHTNPESLKKQTYLKRIIGLDGDLVSFHQGVVLINGVPLETKTFDKNSLSRPNTNLVEEKSQKFSMNPHFILISQVPGNTYAESRRFAVPPNFYFVLGDDRDISVDSRTLGFIGKNEIFAKANGVLFSTEGFSRWSVHFRSERFFQPM